MIIDAGMFGPVTLAGDGASVMDGGTHGCIGHTLRVMADRSAEWERRLDSLGDPGDCAGSGALSLGDADWGIWTKLLDAAWDRSSHPTAPPEGDPDLSPPQYVWAIVMRRGGEVRVLSGPPLGHPWQDPPAAAGALIDWVRSKVGAWCEAARR